MVALSGESSDPAARVIPGRMRWRPEVICPQCSAGSLIRLAAYSVSIFCVSPTRSVSIFCVSPTRSVSMAHIHLSISCNFYCHSSMPIPRTEILLILNLFYVINFQSSLFLAHVSTIINHHQPSRRCNLIACA